MLKNLLITGAVKVPISYTYIIDYKINIEFFILYNMNKYDN